MGEVTTEVDAVVGTAEQKVESSEVVRWEKFLPRMVLRVLLVEADDSTRQIIAAHLRKCSYKVAAVSDGLAAWETLKDRPHSVDLILTEVELPSISGFALLSLIMEHDVCKNIPVIMMSSHDSISTVLKCMLKGAVDFLIKPVRRNELKNLWQHVWRRHTLPGEPAATEPKFEVSAENDDLSNQWSNDGSSVQKNNEASDTQDLSQLKCMNGSDSGREQQGNVVKLGQESLQNEGQPEGNASRLVKVKEVARSGEACEPNASKLEGNPAISEGMTQNDGGNVNVMIRADCNDKLDEPRTGAIDFIGSFNKQPMGTFALSRLTDILDKVEFSSQLDLSLRRSCFSSSKNQYTTERHTLNHSDASAFSWYRNGKSLQPIFPTLAGDQAAMKEDDSKSGQHLECNNDTFQSHFVTRSDSMENLPTPVIDQSKLKFRSTQLGIIPDPGMMIHDMYAACKNAFPQADHEQKGLPPGCNDSEQGYGHKDEATDGSINQIVQEKNKQEPVGELSCSSPIANQSACISICNGVGNHENSSAHGGVSSRSDASVSASFAAATDKSTTTESLNDSNFFSHNGFKGMDTLRSSQREAALMKFRLKRKDRCFEKKVRYQSRKRLAEQRPRVKGQFVRQVANDTPIADGDDL